MKKVTIDQVKETLEQEYKHYELFVSQSLSSIYTKEDVIGVLTRLKDSVLFNIELKAAHDVENDEDQVEEIVSKIKVAVRETVKDFSSSDVCEADYDSAYFSLHRNEIELDQVDIDLDTDFIINSINSAIDEIEFNQTKTQNNEQ